MTYSVAEAIKDVRQAASWHSGAKEAYLLRIASKLEESTGESGAPVEDPGSAPPAVSEPETTPTPEPEAPVAVEPEPSVPDVPEIPSNVAPAP